ncbi:hypothetical protein KDAU_08100 [Dictyobacter aurantiacus]|uniref:Conjugal transfer protein TrbL n=1 Tax=Dictyobacter aurantiacus TaxID=1936993 RepID=A0A401Z9D0_9CHLR|nr:hypothetical protein KDAU_08100 [Dictyobacter aurantiacus]
MLNAILTVVSIFLGNSDLPHNVSCSDNVQNDLLTGDGGWLYAIPLNLTTDNVTIQSLVGVLQALAESMLVLVIMILGIRIMMGGAGGWNFGELLEALPRLIFSVVAVALCLTLAGELITFSNGVSSLFPNSLGQGGLNTKVTDIIMPMGHWGRYLELLTDCGLSFPLAMAAAPFAIFGTNLGAAAAAALVVQAVVSLVTNAPGFCILGFSMALTGIIIARILLINVYIILSPLAVIAAGLPGQVGQNFTRQWIMGFLSLLAAQVAQVVTLFVGMAILDAYNQLFSSSGGDIGGLFIRYGTLLVLLRVPTLFSANSTAIIKEVGPTLGTAIMREKAPFAPGIGS